MANICAVTGKKTTTGNNVSHSKVATRRTFKPNLQTHRLVNPATGLMKKITVSARGLRTLKKWMREGKKFDLNNLEK